jgi:hypothetical protein
MKLDGGADDVIIEEPIAGMSNASLSTAEMQQSIGEAFTSLKQLLNRATQWYSVIAKTATPTGLQIHPWYSSAVSQDATGLIKPYWGGDAYNFIAPMYLFYRGNARLNVVSYQTADGSTGIGYLPSNTVITGSRFTGFHQGSPCGPNQILGYNATTNFDYVAGVGTESQGMVIATANTGVTSWQVPYSSAYKVSLNTTMKSLNAVTADASKARGSLILNSTGGLANYVVYRSFDDNFHLSFFLGCPPLLVNAT